MLNYILEHVDEMEAIGPCHAEGGTGLTVDVPPKASAIHTSKNMRALLHEMLLVMGYSAIKSQQVQEIFRWGTSSNLLQQLCNLPVTYFSQYKHVLFPTLIILCFNNPQNRRIILQEVSAAPVSKFIVQYAQDHDILMTLPTKDPKPKPKPKPKPSPGPRTSPAQSGSTDKGTECRAHAEPSAAAKPRPKATGASQAKGPSTPQKAAAAGAAASASHGSAEEAHAPGADKEGAGHGAPVVDAAAGAEAVGTVTGIPPSPDASKKKAKKKAKGVEGAEEEEHACRDSDPGNVGAPEYRPVCQSPFFSFERRFPVELWPDAKAFFDGAAVG